MELSEKVAKEYMERRMVFIDRVVREVLAEQNIRIPYDSSQVELTVVRAREILERNNLKLIMDIHETEAGEVIDVFVCKVLSSRRAAIAKPTFTIV